MIHLHGFHTIPWHDIRIRTSAFGYHEIEPQSSYPFMQFHHSNRSFHWQSLHFHHGISFFWLTLVTWFQCLWLKNHNSSNVFRIVIRIDKNLMLVLVLLCLRLCFHAGLLESECINWIPGFKWRVNWRHNMISNWNSSSWCSRIVNLSWRCLSEWSICLLSLHECAIE